jgi:hypothetical protein
VPVFSLSASITDAPDSFAANATSVAPVFQLAASITDSEDVFMATAINVLPVYGISATLLDGEDLFAAQVITISVAATRTYTIQSPITNQLAMLSRTDLLIRDKSQVTNLIKFKSTLQ